MISKSLVVLGEFASLKPIAVKDDKKQEWEADAVQDKQKRGDDESRKVIGIKTHEGRLCDEAPLGHFNDLHRIRAALLCHLDARTVKQLQCRNCQLQVRHVVTHDARTHPARSRTGK